MRRGAREAFGAIAKEIVRARREFHPTQAAGSGLHAYDGRLPDYSPACVQHRLQEIEAHLRALQTFEAKADRKSTRLNSSHIQKSRMPSSA